MNSGTGSLRKWNSLDFGDYWSNGLDSHLRGSKLFANLCCSYSLMRSGMCVIPGIVPVGIGTVGIGLTNPTYQLQLSTDSAAKPGTSTWTIASDERLKDIRAPFTRGLQDLDGLHTVYFNYKQGNPLDLPSDKEFVGIKAQDALKVIPEAVSKDDKGYYHVTNDSIIWTYIGRIHGPRLIRAFLRSVEHEYRCNSDL